MIKYLKLLPGDLKDLYVAIKEVFHATFNGGIGEIEKENIISKMEMNMKKREEKLNHD